MFRVYNSRFSNFDIVKNDQIGSTGPTGPTGPAGLSSMNTTNLSQISQSKTGSILLRYNDQLFYSDKMIFNDSKQLGNTGPTVIVDSDIVPSKNLHYNLGSTGSKWH